jgi:Caspase domain
MLNNKYVFNRRMALLIHNLKLINKKRRPKRNPVKRQPIRRQPIRRQPINKFIRKQPVRRQPVRRQLVKKPPIKKPPIKKPPIKKPPIKKHHVAKSVNNYFLSPEDLARNANTKALLIGINYYTDNFSKSELNGCINDVYNIQQLLLARNFNPSNIIILADISNNLNTNNYPTKKNIVESLINLYKNGGPNIFFYYSGHGGEIDVSSPIQLNTQYGQLDFIVPSDFNPNNISSIITDIEIKNIVNQYGHAYQTASMFFDSCVNQTVVNLKYGYYNTLPNNYPYQRTINNITVYINQTLSKSQVFEISGSTDKSNCLDSYNVKLNQPDGAYTMAFLNCFTPDTNIVYSWTSFLMAQRNWLKNNNYKQIPQLGTGRYTNPDITYINF